MEQKTFLHILKLESRQEIERRASELSINDAKRLFQHIAQSPQEYEEKIPSLLAGLPNSVFAGLLPSLQLYAKSPIVQHQTVLLFEKSKENFNKSRQKLDSLTGQIASFAPSPLSSDAITALESNIEDAAKENELELELLKQMAKIAWIAERSDLIAEFSSLQTTFLHLSYLFELLPEFLAKKLEESLGSLDGASNQEVLRSFGFTYPEDFEPLFLALKIAPDMSKLENELAQRGLASVKDFKEHRIFTKKMLLAYLDKIH